MVEGATGTAPAPARVEARGSQTSRVETGTRTGATGTEGVQRNSALADHLRQQNTGPGKAHNTLTDIAAANGKSPETINETFAPKAKQAPPSPDSSTSLPALPDNASAEPPAAPAEAPTHAPLTADQRARIKALMDNMNDGLDVEQRAKLARAIAAESQPPASAEPPAAEPVSDSGPATGGGEHAPVPTETPVAAPVAEATASPVITESGVSQTQADVPAAEQTRTFTPEDATIHEPTHTKRDKGTPVTENGEPVAPIPPAESLDSAIATNAENGEAGELTPEQQAQLAAMKLGIELATLDPALNSEAGQAFLTELVKNPELLEKYKELRASTQAQVETVGAEATQAGLEATQANIEQQAAQAEANGDTETAGKLKSLLIILAVIIAGIAAAAAVGPVALGAAGTIATAGGAAALAKAA